MYNQFRENTVRVMQVAVMLLVLIGRCEAESSPVISPEELIIQCSSIRGFMSEFHASTPEPIKRAAAAFNIARASRNVPYNPDEIDGYLKLKWLIIVRSGLGTNGFIDQVINASESNADLSSISKRSEFLAQLYLSYLVFDKRSAASLMIIPEEIEEHDGVTLQPFDVSEHNRWMIDDLIEGE